MTTEERAAYMREYYRANIKKLKASRRKWYLKNAKAINARRRKKYNTDEAFRDTERERCRAYARKRKEEREDGLA